MEGHTVVTFQLKQVKHNFPASWCCQGPVTFDNLPAGNGNTSTDTPIITTNSSQCYSEDGMHTPTNQTADLFKYAFITPHFI